MTNGDADLASVGVLLAEPARAAILVALTSGLALPAGRLASEAGVAPSTASAHLSRLVDGGLITVEQHGRHRYYRLAGHEVAEFLEQVSAWAPRRPVRSLNEDWRARALTAARTCYDHLAGRLGVALLVALLDKGIVEGHDGSYRPGIDRLSAPGPDIVYRLTEPGRDTLVELGIATDGFGRRPAMHHCLDWTEQRHHLSGGLGAAIATRCFELDWVERVGSSRAVRVTPAGEAGFADGFGLQPDAYAR
jgi:DNA-binding transcriptional ArsR family regulator